MLTRIIEIVSGQFFADFLMDNILRPLEMSNTGLDRPADIIRRRARGYVFDDQGALTNSPYLNITMLAGAGGLYSTVEDMLKWCLAVKEHKILTKASWERMITPNVNNYGYGFFITTSHGRRTVSHPGGVSGFATQFVLFPDDDVFLILLKNIENAPRIFDPVEMIEALLFNERYEFPTERKSVFLNDQQVSPLLGAYEIKPGLILTITMEQRKIYVQVPGQPRLEIVPESENSFFISQIAASLNFSKEGERVTGVTLRQHGVELRAKRIQ